MDLQTVVLAGLSIVSACLGWFARELWNAVQKLREDLLKLEVKIGTDYVRYDRLQDALEPILTTLKRIEDTLTHKVDKD